MTRFYLLIMVGCAAATVRCGEDHVVLSIEGEVISFDGSALQNANVTLYEQGFLDRRLIAQAFTNNRGEYQIGHVMGDECPEALLQLDVSKTGHVTQRITRQGYALGHHESYVKCVNGVQRIDFKLEPEPTTKKAAESFNYGRPAVTLTRAQVEYGLRWQGPGTLPSSRTAFNIESNAAGEVLGELANPLHFTVAGRFDFLDYTDHRPGV